MPNETLKLLAREVRGKTFRILDGVSDEQARFVPPGLNNSILWHAGHSLWVVEVLSIAAATGRPAPLPDGWTDLFSSKSRPTRETKFPALAQIIEGNVEALDKIDIRKDAKLIGDIKTARIVIEDGAYFKGSIDIVKTDAPKQAQPRPQAAAASASQPNAVPQNAVR